jgi:hypothetical protein
MQQARKQLFNAGDGGIKFVQNIGEVLLQKATSLKIVIFMVITVRTSNPAFFCVC